MARTYGELVGLVRSWSNRDAQVLSDSVIQDCLKYAADKAYRSLRVPPLEASLVYGSTALVAATSQSANGLPTITTVAIPGDYIETIQIREMDSNGITTRVFNEKVDVRTFNDAFSTIHYSSGAYFSRQGPNFILGPGFGHGTGTADKLEVYYYKRLPALDAQYTVSPSNYTAGLLSPALANTTGAVLLYLNAVGGTTTINAYTTQGAAQTANRPNRGDVLSSQYFTGLLVPNWLRDDNERILLNGALAEVFFFLQDDDQASKYASLFKEEIASLNDEDKKRHAKGGNIQTSYSGGGLI